MKTTFNFQGTEFKVSSTFKGDKKANWSNDRYGENWNNHIVSVSTKHGRTTFEFWGSIAEPEIRKRSDLKNAFYCFVSDALSAKESFENFCSEFGYSSDSIQALKTYKACETSLKKLERVFNGDLWTLANSLND